MWYKHLVPKESVSRSLLSSETIFDGNLIICRQHKYREYSLFENFIVFLDYFMKVPDQQKCFYEVILPRPQKIYFDIDINDIVKYPLEKVTRDLEIFTEALRKLLIDLTRSKFLIQIYESHSESKISFHIVVDGIYVQNNLCNKWICEKIESYLIDPKVYKSIQQFRCLMAQKEGSNRPKVPNFELFLDYTGVRGWTFEYKNERHLTMNLMKMSLVTVTSGCDFLHIELPVIQKTSYKHSESCVNVDEEDVEKIKELYREKVGKFCFTEPEIITEDGIVFLTVKRKSGSMCPTCNRVHDNENPYFLICGEEHNVFFDCRRSDMRFYLGSLKPKIVEEMKTVEEIQDIKPEKTSIKIEMLTVGSAVINSKKFQGIKNNIRIDL